MIAPRQPVQAAQGRNAARHVENGRARRGARRHIAGMLQVHSHADAFAPEECARILALAETVPARDARLVGRARDHNIRRSDLVWLDDLDEGAGWIMDRLIEVVRVANRANFGFDLDAFSESPQIAAYDARREAHFDWHSDIGDGPLAARRKLTLVVQLSAPDTYAGGRLELMPGARRVEAQTAQGSASVFPAYLLHRVTPVSGGTRRSLTVWAHGPRFR